MYSWWWVELSPETCRVKPLRRINAIVASCWIYFTIKHNARNHKVHLTDITSISNEQRVYRTIGTVGKGKNVHTLTIKVSSAMQIKSLPLWFAELCLLCREADGPPSLMKFCCGQFWLNSISATLNESDEGNIEDDLVSHAVHRSAV